MNRSAASRCSSAKPASGHRPPPVTIIVPNASAHFDKAKYEGATVWEELHEIVYGELQYGAEDLDGHRWLFSQHVRDLHPSDWGATVAPGHAWRSPATRNRSSPQPTHNSPIPVTIEQS